MNPHKISEALNTIQLGLGELAEALNDSPTPERAGGPGAAVSPAAAPASTFSTASTPSVTYDSEYNHSEYNQQTGDQGSAAVCPKHRVPYADGTYGLYCKQRTDDEAWGKQKGDTMWCRITPKNAAQYLRVQAAA